jgi:hypothetical protein
MYNDVCDERLQQNQKYKGSGLPQIDYRSSTPNNLKEALIED